METTNNAIVDHTLQFSLKIIAYCDELEERRKYVISRQLLRAGTSIGANVREAQSAESKSDFIHKLKVADKEAHETEYWLILCNMTPSYPDCDFLLPKLKEIKMLLSTIITNSKKSL